MSTQLLRDEAERAAYRRHVTARIATDGFTLSDTAAFVADVLATAPQLAMWNPLSVYAAHYFDAHADELSIRTPSRDEFAAAVAELTELALLPHWCATPSARAEGGAR